jgi:hypothetical protein
MRLNLIVILLFINFSLIGQEKKLNAIEMLEKVREEGGTIAQLIIDENGDTLLFYKMRPVIIYPPRKFKNKRKRRKYTRMVRYVKKVYPYSIIIKNIFVESEFVLRNMDNEREKKLYIKQKEKELKKEFEDDIRNMTYSQGRILIKLVDRETSHTTYELVKHFKGGVSAFFWQGVAKVFQTDLKYEYDPEGTDKWIEEIVALIENGQL